VIVQRALDAARAAQSRGDTDDAQRLLTDVQRYLDGRLSSADLYESVREAMPAGADRTGHGQHAQQEPDTGAAQQGSSRHGADATGAGGPRR